MSTDNNSSNDNVVTIRGICNPTGTACHLSCALLILCHCFVPLRQKLITELLESSQSLSDNDPFLYELATFLKEWTTGNGGTDDSKNPPIDPSSLYAAIRETMHIEAHELGDAVTALMKLLNRIRESNSNLHTIEEIYCNQIDSGRVHFVITGEKLVTKTGQDHDHEEEGNTTTAAAASTRVRRTKETKIRPMACPFPIDTGEFDCLEDGLLKALTPRTLEGYKWSGKYHEEEEVVPTTTGTTIYDDEKCWKTTKSLVVDNLPDIWMIHPSSSSSKPKDNNYKHSATISIPSKINVGKFLPLGDKSKSNNHHHHQQHYILAGGILHVSEMDDEEEEPDNNEEGGHYVAVVRKHRYLLDKNDDDDDDEEKDWYLIDDEEICQLSEQSCLKLLAGASSKDIVSTKGTTGTYLKGVLLVYNNNNNNNNRSMI